MISSTVNQSYAIKSVVNRLACVWSFIIIPVQNPQPVISGAHTPVHALLTGVTGQRTIGRAYERHLELLV